MVAEPADVVAGVVEVVRVAAERGVVAQVFAVLLVVDGLPHGVDRLQDPAFDRLELTHPHRVHRAVVLQVVGALLGLKIQ